AYDPEAAWQNALAALDPHGSGLALLAAQLRSSALDLDDARELAAAVDAVAADHPGADWPPAVEALAAEETRQAGTRAAIAGTLRSTPLASEILPWLDELDQHTARGLEAVQLLRAVKPSL